MTAFMGNLMCRFNSMCLNCPSFNIFFAFYRVEKKKRKEEDAPSKDESKAKKARPPPPASTAPKLDASK